MKCYVRRIGVIDHQQKIHHVDLLPGVNVITGKSSTGKSAMIEIFDYCLGSSGFTVPDGVITTCAQLYFIVLQFPEMYLLLARKGGEAKIFIKEISNPDSILSQDSPQLSFFQEEYFLPLYDFKKELGRYFGLTMDNTDESDIAQFRNRKSPTPSIRSFTSFMLQHQNLIANKHAIFYRFDEKEKREQTIDHLKVFLGYADQSYFILSQKVSGLKTELRKIEQQLPRQEELRKQTVEKLKGVLEEYLAVTGTQLIETTPEIMAENPAKWVEVIKNISVKIEGAASAYSMQNSALEAKRSIVVSELRKLERQRSAVVSSMRFADEYAQSAQSVSTPTAAAIRASICPFCNSTQQIIEIEANRLAGAIEWLNEELRRSPYLRESFEADEHRLSELIDQKRLIIRDIERQLKNLDQQIIALQNMRPMNEIALKSKLRVETMLEELSAPASLSLLESKLTFESEIALLEKKLKNYKMDKKMQEATELIESYMAQIGKRFDFEASYQPINLKFFIDSFDLCHEMIGGRRVYLRSMGSGANWLYCHLTLFMALQQLFCKLVDTCKIPPILFLDQPSQVYFPSLVADFNETFDAHSLASMTGKTLRVDDDIQAVENLYSQMVDFCNRVKTETGVEPQIIISDHADKLNLNDGTSFESLVRARWRTRGFIDPVMSGDSVLPFL